MKDAKGLQIANDLTLALDHIVGKNGIFASTGMGKTHLAHVLAEGMLARGETVVAIDPTDAWWGLRSSADGQAEGYPILVLGGKHGDLPLQLHSAANLADAVVADRFSCVICTDGLHDDQEQAFVRGFLEQLYRRNTRPLHLFVDEADLFAPQQPKGKEDFQSVKAMSRIVRRGRSKGIGTTLITQRPSELAAAVRTQIETLFVLGLNHELDIKAIEMWMRVRNKASGRRLSDFVDNSAYERQQEMLDSLDSLPRGDAWVWSPRRGLHQRFHTRAKETFDSSGTPAHGTRVRDAKRLAKVDVELLGSSLAAAAQEQRDNDPAQLRKQIADLQRELAAARAAATVVEVEKVIEVARPIGPNLTKLRDIARALDVEFDALEVAAAATLPTNGALAIARAPALNYQRSEPAARPAMPAASPAPRGRAAGLEPREQKVLDALAWWSAIGVAVPTMTAAAVVAGYSPTNSSFEKSRGRLRAIGLIDLPGPGAITLTAAGAAAARLPAAPPTTAELHEMALAQLEPRERRLLVPLLRAYPKALSMAALATAAGYDVDNSSFEKSRGRLRAIGLIDIPHAGAVCATDLLFLTGGSK